MAHGDYTGTQKSALAQKFADEQRLAASSTSLVTQVVSEARTEVIDLRNDVDRFYENNAYAPDEDSEEGVQVVDVKDPNMQPAKFRARETLEDITVGKDRHFSLEEGRIYVAPKWVVEHLDTQGLVYH